MTCITWPKRCAGNSVARAGRVGVLLSLSLFSVSIGWAQGPARPPVKPQTKPSVQVPQRLTPRPSAGPAKSAGRPTGEDPVRGEEYLFKMAAALIRPGLRLGPVFTTGSITHHSDQLPQGHLKMTFEGMLSFPSRMRLTSEVMGRTAQVELLDSVARSSVWGVSQPQDAKPLLLEMARHYLNLAQSCRQLKATYVGAEGPSTARLLKLHLIVPRYLPGPIEIWLDAKSFLPVKLRYPAEHPFHRTPMVAEEVLSDWHGVGGLKMAYTRKISYNGSLVTEEVLTEHRLNR